MKKITLLTFMLTSFIMFSQTWSTGVINFNGSYSGMLDVTSSTVTLTLIGPDDRWLGMGFNVTCMNSGNDAVIFDGTNLTDRNFVGIGVQPALDSNQDWSITSNTTNSGVRTLVASRNRVTGDSNDFEFPTSEGAMNFIWAYRNAAGFSITSHGGNRGSVTSSFTLSEEEFNINEFKLFPNPSSDKLNIKSINTLSEAQIEIFDAIGRQVYYSKLENISGLLSIDINGWNNGIYIVKLKSIDGEKAQRFVKY
ncbi:MAG: T9SS type A sorting domain-containing protein [Bacteroidia bacterium]|nr:T9SS type A sorting domain-containing protein [Bacteroidia bacterium]